MSAEAGASTARWWQNPIIDKELRSRMRNSRSAFLITASLTVLGAIGYLAYEGQRRSIEQGSLSYLTPQVGRTIFQTLIFAVLVMVVFLAPALTAGAISGERERQTLDLLLCTPVSAGSIIVGKLVSSLMFVLLLLVVSVPLFSIVFLFGGVEPAQVISVFSIVVMAAMALGALGVFCSTVARRSTGATVLAYALTFVYLAGPYLAAFAIPALLHRGDPGGFFRGSIYQQSEPFYALTAALDTSTTETTVAQQNRCFPDGSGGTTCTSRSVGTLAPGSPQAQGLNALSRGPFGDSWKLYMLLNTVVAATFVGATVMALSGGLSKMRLPKITE